MLKFIVSLTASVTTQAKANHFFVFFTWFYVCELAFASFCKMDNSSEEVSFISH
uniref:Uncharacterized protein n=1 Tax=Rhizophora mucronata TaxID=61149 RepID=A0A2P2KPV5_RHIMU